MTDIDAIELLKELQKYNLESRLVTPKNSSFDLCWDCAIVHAIHALERRAGVAGEVTYTAGPNGSFKCVM